MDEVLSSRTELNAAQRPSLPRLKRRPHIPLQHGTNDCGYVCVTAILAMLGRRAGVAEIKAKIGESTRGLTILQLKQGFHKLGIKAPALAFDAKIPTAIPSPSVCLLKSAHYIVIARISKTSAEVFYPERGWARVPLRELSKELNGLGLEITGLEASFADHVYETVNGKASTDAINALTKAALSRPQGIRNLVLALIAQILVMLLPLMGKFAVDGVAANLETGYFSLLCAGLILATVLSSATSGVAKYVNIMMDKSLAISLASMIFERLAAKPLSWFESQTTLSIENRIGLVESQRDFHSSLPFEIIRIVVSVIFGIVALFFVSLWLVVPGLLSTMVSALADWRYNIYQRHLVFAAIVARNRKMAMAFDLMPQIPLLRKFGSLVSAKNGFRRRSREAANAELRRDLRQAKMAIFSTNIKLFEKLAFMALTTYFVKDNLITMGTFVAVAVYKDSLSDSIASAFRLYQRYSMIEPLKMEVDDIFSISESKNASNDLQAVSSGRVEILGLSDRYGDFGSYILNNLSMTIEAGEFVMLSGESGVGKTTLMKIISGFRQPAKGMVRIDGIPASHISGGVGVVLQSDRLMQGSIRENIKFYRNSISDSEILASLDLAGLADFVNGLPMRLDTPVGEGIIGLSGGQRQRLLLARALVAQPRLLILDEATSNLDVDLEKSILQKIKMNGATVVMCAHRPEVWVLADRHYRLDSNGHLTPQVDIQQVHRE